MLRIDPPSYEPSFAELHEQILTQVSDGILAPGDRLPTVRRFDGDLGIAPNTVAPANRELEADGVLEGRGRAGDIRPVHRDGVQDRNGGRFGTRSRGAVCRGDRALGLTPAEALASVRPALGT